MKRRITAFALVMIMTVLLLPVSALADGGIYLSVDGIQFTEAKQTIKCGNGTATLDWYTYGAPELILENADITGFSKFINADGGIEYAGIAYEGEYPLNIVLKGTNTITAPEHSKGFYEGILCVGDLRLSYDDKVYPDCNLNIRNVDIGIVADNGTDGNMSINSCFVNVDAAYIGISVHSLTGAGNINVSCSGPVGISADRIKLDLFGEINVKMHTDAEKYNGSVGISANTIDEGVAVEKIKYSVESTMDASKYRGTDPVTLCCIAAVSAEANEFSLKANLNTEGLADSRPASVMGVVCTDLQANWKSECNVTLNGRAQDYAAGIIAENKLTLLSSLKSAVEISGEHADAVAVSAGTIDANHPGSELHATIKGADRDDAALEILDASNMRNAYFIYAETDCKDSIYGAAVLGGGLNLSGARIAWPLNGKQVVIEDEDVRIGIITDADGNPAESVVITEDEYQFRDIGNLIDSFKVAVKWATENGITTGYSPVEFRPDVTCTRGQVVTFLWRAKGSPEPESKINPFADVSASGGTAPYYKAILWAYENGITTGFDETHFRPSAPCTRGQVVTFLWRASGSPEPCGDNHFNDVSDTGKGAPYYKAILWAAENGITTGYNDGSFRPGSSCTRAHIVTFLYRADSNVKGREIVDVIVDVYPEEPGESPVEIAGETYGPNPFEVGPNESWEYVPVNVTAVYADGSEDTISLSIAYRFGYGHTDAVPPENWITVAGINTLHNAVCISFSDNAAPGNYGVLLDYDRNSAKIVCERSELIHTSGSYVFFVMHGHYFQAHDFVKGSTFNIYAQNIAYIVDYLQVGNYMYFGGHPSEDSRDIFVYRFDLRDSICADEIARYTDCDGISFDNNGYVISRTEGGEAVSTRYSFP